MRVVSGWMNDREFLDDQGKPACLPLDGSRGSFNALVRKYSGDIPVRAMRAMLEEGRTIAVEGTTVRLIRHAYVPGRDDMGKIAILGSDVSELIATIDHNLVADPDELWFQRKLSHDNIPPKAADRLRKLSAKKAQALLEVLDRKYADTKGEGDTVQSRQVSIGIYYYEHETLNKND